MIPNSLVAALVRVAIVGLRCAVATSGFTAYDLRLQKKDPFVAEPRVRILS